MALDRRQRTCLWVRGVAALGIPVAVALPPGPLAVTVGLAGGLVAVLAQPRRRSGGWHQPSNGRVHAPQGDWPPYDPGRVVDGELVPPRSP